MLINNVEDDMLCDDGAHLAKIALATSSLWPTCHYLPYSVRLSRTKNPGHADRKLNFGTGPDTGEGIRNWFHDRKSRDNCAPYDVDWKETAEHDDPRQNINCRLQRTLIFSSCKTSYAHNVSLK